MSNTSNHTIKSLLDNVESYEALQKRSPQERAFDTLWHDLECISKQGGHAASIPSSDVHLERYLENRFAAISDRFEVKRIAGHGRCCRVIKIGKDGCARFSCMSPGCTFYIQVSF
jgi:hypothetical protein